MAQAENVMPRASCIMPTANRRRFVGGAIARFLAQDFGDAELVILDDGEDAVADLVPEAANIRYIRAGKFKTLGAKRNAAVEAARGQVLLHWDDDDWYAPHRVRVQVEALLASGADVCGIDRAYFMDPAAGAAWEYVYPQNARAPWVCGATLCYTREFWTAHKFAQAQVGEDTIFAAAVKPERLHVLADHRFFVALIHPGNTSPKRTRDSRWRRADYGEVRGLTGDWPEGSKRSLFEKSSAKTFLLPGDVETSRVKDSKGFCGAPPARGPFLQKSDRLLCLVAAAGGIGDILRATPLIRALHLMGHQVDVLLAPDAPQAAELLHGAPEIHALHVAAPAETRYEFAMFTRWAAPLAGQVRADKILHFHPGTWLERGDSACVAALAREAGWQGKLPLPFAQTSARDFGLPPGTIGLHPGCKPGWPWKRWHGFAELAGMLEHVVILGTESDRETAGTYFQPLSWPAHARDFTGKLSLADSAALISQCAGFVANDSGLMHLAATLGVPTLGVFGITSPQREAMEIPAMHPVTKGMACEPACRRGAWGRRDCALHLACLKELSAGVVHARLESILLKEMPAMLRKPFPPNPLPQRPRAVPPPRPAAPPAPAPVASHRLRLAVRMEGGIGDLIIAARLVEAAYLALGHCEIDLFHHNVEAARFVFFGTRFVHAFHPAQSREGGHDVTLHTQHYANFVVHDAARLRRFAPDAGAWMALAARRFGEHRGLFERRPSLDGVWGRLSVGQGRNVLDNLGFLSGLAVSRATQVVLTPDIEAIATLPALLGDVGAYITVHDGFDNNTTLAPGQATKCWPLAHWEAFVAQWRVAAPEVKIVQLGGRKSRAIAGVDVNLVNCTTLHQAAWVLKNAVLHVDTDSGLVHLAQALHKPAIALFGPTDAGLYGHDEHVAVQAGDCHGCWWSAPDWLWRCPRGLAQPACMAAITPEQVVEAAAAVLGKQVTPHVELLTAALYEGALMSERAEELRRIFADAGMAPVPVREHGRSRETGAYLHASKQWEYLFVMAALPELAGLRVLDAGGGRGALPFHLAAAGAEVEVIDRDFLWDNGGDLDIERRFMQGNARLRIRHGGVHNLPVADESFDVVTCISVIEHVQGKEIVLRELLRVLKPGGRLVMTFDIASTPERFEDGMRVEIFSPARLGAFLGAEVFTAAAVDASAVRIQEDGVAGIPVGMTVGGVVLRKN